MKSRQHRERGASAVEMAMVAPFLLIILLGIIEFGFVFGQYNEVRHAAREGARYAAVGNIETDTDADLDIDADDIKNTICNVINLSNANIQIDIDLLTTGDIGENATVTVTAHTQSLSGAPLISTFVPDSLANTATFRIEQSVDWVDATYGSVSTDAC